MTLFSEKLEGLPETTALLANCDLKPMVEGIIGGRGRHTIAVGSGGSAIAASYFARCRETAFGQPTTVETPMQLVIGLSDLSNSDIWLFSASAGNPDIVAALHAAIARRALNINLVTRNPAGTVSREILSNPQGWVHQISVSDRRDGFLATHSLIGSVGAMLLAFDAISDDPVGDVLAPEFERAVRKVISLEIRTRVRGLFEMLSADDVLFIVADPQLEPVSMLIETSAWEVGLCPVQRTDFRNFAHGRHTWIEHRHDRTFVLALTGVETRDVWRPLSELLPSTQRQACLDFGDCGRFRNAVGIVEGLVLVEAMGLKVGIDPAKPGIGPFGKPIYENTALRDLSANLGPAVRQKRTAILRRDDPTHTGLSISAVGRARLDALAKASFRGLVLDYDGTIVSTEGRYGPPPRKIVRELTRLDQAGVRIAVATGRGGSAGEELRKMLPPEIHGRVLMGYYNGGYIKFLDIDIQVEPPPPDPAIEEVFAWLQSESRLFREFGAKNSGVQITIPLTNLLRPERFATDLERCPAMDISNLKIVHSAHSIDLIVAGVSKAAVVAELCNSIKGVEPAILCIGDSGSRRGNDHELLSSPFGVSVGEVCGRPSGCWSFFGEHLTGPEALLEVLQAVKQDASGRVCLDVSSLTLDTAVKMSTNREHEARKA